MQNAAETVYEFGSSPDEDDDNNDTGQPSSLKNKLNQQQQSSTSSSTITASNIAGSNLRQNKISSTSINQKLNTSFSSLSDNHPSSHAPNSKKNLNNPSSSSSSSSHQNLIDTNRKGNNDYITSSDDQLLLNDNNKNSISNISNTSLSTASTASSRNINNQSGNVGGGGSNNVISNINQSLTGTISQKGQAASTATLSSSQLQQSNPNFDSNVISERVKNLATQIYQELKRIISRCNYDDDILSGLMPLIVRVLESLDLALIENQQLQVELELCKDDNEQLVIMFEKEKAAKRAIDKRLIESEYAYEEERQQYQQKIESLDNVVKMFELKAKNASDQAARFEEKEVERKKEYHKLHDRYTELLKSHCDVVERFRHLAGNAEVANIGSINVPQQMIASSSDLTLSDSLQPQQIGKAKLKPDDLMEAAASSLRSTRETLKSWNAETELTLEDASLVVIDDALETNKLVQDATQGDGSSHNEFDKTTLTSLTTNTNDHEHEKESENDSIAYTSMEKEFRKLIQENKDLLNTKNALNVVKDDLIAEVDRLTNEVSMYEQAVEQLNTAKDQMKQKVFALDAELRKTKEELDKAKQKIRENNEEGVPYSQRKRFGRAEMAKVLMERNSYKERYMELQDAVRYTELVRANKVETEKRSGLWKFFSNLFGAPPLLAIGPTGANQSMNTRNSSPVVSYSGSTVDQQGIVGGPGGVAAASVGPIDVVNSSLIKQNVGNSTLAAAANTSIRATSQRLSSNSDLIVLMDSDLNIDRANVNNRSLNSEMLMSGYIHAYGWTLPASAVQKTLAAKGSVGDLNASDLSPALQADVVVDGQKKQALSLSGLQVPIPQYCRPLTGDSLGMKIWCATAIDLSGGYAMAALEQPAAQQTISRANRMTGDSSFSEANSSGSIVNISTSTPIKSSPGADRSRAASSLRMLEKEVDKALNESILGENSDFTAATSSKLPLIKTTTEMILSSLPIADSGEELSSCVWICSTQHSRSKITIIDIKTKPNELLDSFYIPTFLYCIKSIPGSKLSDLPGISSLEQTEKLSIEQDHNEEVKQAPISGTLNVVYDLIETQKREFYKLIGVDLEAEKKLRSNRLEAEAKRKKKRVTIDEQLNKTIEGLTLEEETNNADANRNNVSTGSSNKSGSILSEDDAEISRILDNNVSVGIATLQKLHDFVAHTQQPEPEGNLNDQSRDNTENIESSFKSAAAAAAATGIGLEQPPAGSEPDNYKDVVYYQPISTSLSTVWMGGKDSILYIHSAIGQWKDCIACLKLSDSILQICHFRGRVFVALADGSLCVFFRNFETKEWELSQYLSIDINLMAEVTNNSISDLASVMTNTVSKETVTEEAQSATGANTSLMEETRNMQLSSPVKRSPIKANISATSIKGKKVAKVAGIKCLEIASKNLWIGYRNRVLIIDPITLKLRHSFSVVPQVDNQIRQLISMKDGVFICLRSDLILRLYSSIKPYQHIQNIDIEPIVSRLISPKTFVISHITAMKVAHDNTLWIGNAHGIILTIPCKLVAQVSEAPMVAGVEYSEETPSGLSIARFVPNCDITNAQISFHGHKDAVKFFVHAHNLMLSGGQGYLDFRLDMDDQSKSISDKSHLILWQLPATGN